MKDKIYNIIFVALVIIVILHPRDETRNIFGYEMSGLALFLACISITIIFIIIIFLLSWISKTSQNYIKESLGNDEITQEAKEVEDAQTDSNPLIKEVEEVLMLVIAYILLSNGSIYLLIDKCGLDTKFETTINIIIIILLGLVDFGLKYLKSRKNKKIEN